MLENELATLVERLLARKKIKIQLQNTTPKIGKFYRFAEFSCLLELEQTHS